MKTPSATVQTAQQLLEEWGSSPKSSPAEWLETEIENCAHRLLQLVSVRDAMRAAAMCECGDRSAIEFPGEWEAGWDLGASEAHVRVSNASGLAAASAFTAEDAKRAADTFARGLESLRVAAADQLIAEREAMEASDLAATPVFALNLYTSPIAEVQPSPAEDLERAVMSFAEMATMRDDPHAEKRDWMNAQLDGLAAHRRLWRDAPEWATHLSEDWDGRCDWWRQEPTLKRARGSCRTWRCSAGDSYGALRAPQDNLLGSVRCEPRPGVEG